MKKLLSVLCTLMLIFGVAVSAQAAGEEKIVAYGLDVSYAQGDINWKNVAADGKTFAIIRAGYTGKGAPDTHFEKNYAGAHAAGLDIGCYMYCYATTVAKAEQDAKDVISFLKGKRLEYPVYYDMEDSKLQALTTAERTAIAIAFVKYMQNNGYLAGVYANNNWLTNYLNRAEIEKECGIWYAAWQYSNKPDVDRSQYGLFQYTSQGKVNGVNGNVALDVAYLDYPTLIRKAGLSGQAKNTYLTTGNMQDINGDGATNLKDVALLSQYVAGWEKLSLTEKVLTANGAGKPATLKDVVALMQKVSAK